MKKAVSAMMIVSAAASAALAGNVEQTQDNVFKPLTQDSANANAIGTLFETGVVINGFAEWHNSGFSDVLVKQWELQNEAVMTAELSVMRAHNILLASERDRRIQYLTRELEQMKAAAAAGTSVTVSVEDIVSTDVQTSDSINVLNAKNAILAEEIRIGHGRIDTSRIEAELVANEKTINQLRVESVTHYSKVTKMTNQVTLIDKELQPAIVNLEQRISALARGQSVSAGDKAIAIAQATQSLRLAKGKMFAQIDNLRKARALKLLAVGGGVFALVDSAGRVLMLAGGHDPGLTSVGTLSAAAVESFKK
jgi:flagellar biosynthesis regulator FlaF